jgi:hypothetical protein
MSKQAKVEDAVEDVSEQLQGLKRYVKGFVQATCKQIASMRTELQQREAESLRDRKEAQQIGDHAHQMSSRALSTAQDVADGTHEALDRTDKLRDAVMHVAVHADSAGAMADVASDDNAHVASDSSDASGSDGDMYYDMYDDSEERRIAALPATVGEAYSRARRMLHALHNKAKYAPRR